MSEEGKEKVVFVVHAEGKKLGVSDAKELEEALVEYFRETFVGEGVSVRVEAVSMTEEEWEALSEFDGF